MSDEEILELMCRRRHQILAHSVVYYVFDESVIDDHTFDQWSRELADLMKEHPKLARKGRLAKAFRYFDGSTGAFLPLRDPRSINMGARVLFLAEHFKTHPLP